jgi:hypothetical protein
VAQRGEELLRSLLGQRRGRHLSGSQADLNVGQRVGNSRQPNSGIF